MDELKDMKEDIKEIKTTLVQNTVQLEKYNVLLDVHIKRSEHLEQRIVPIEEHVMFLRKLGTLSVKIASLMAAIAGLITFYLRIQK